MLQYADTPRCLLQDVKSLRAQSVIHAPISCVIVLITDTKRTKGSVAVLATGFLALSFNSVSPCCRSQRPDTVHLSIPLSFKHPVSSKELNPKLQNKIRSLIQKMTSLYSSTLYSRWYRTWTSSQLQNFSFFFFFFVGDLFRILLSFVPSFLGGLLWD